MLSIRRMLMMEDDEEMKEWKLIKDITLEEKTNTLEVNKDTSNNNFECDEIVFYLKSVGTSSNTNSNKNAVFYLSGIDVGYLPSISFANGVSRVFANNINAKPLYWNGFCVNQNADTTGNVVASTFGGYSFVDPIEKINSIKIRLQVTYFGVGTRLRVYGR